MAAVAVMCCAMTIMAEPVSPSVAQQAAAKFLQAKGTSLEGECMQAKVVSRRKVSGKLAEASPYYVFNATDSRGFVIVSGDDCVGDNLVLGYTEQGSFDENNVPANMQAWFDDLAAQITIMSGSGIKVRQVAVHEDIAPMVTSQWSQKYPFNSLCPVKDGGQSVTGCVATALAQIINYHRWPKEPVVGPLPAYVNFKDLVTEDELPSVTFDWDNILDIYDDNATQEQCLAVGTLMRYCGQIVQMGYSPKASSAQYIDLDMMMRNFGYDQGATMVNASSYSVQGWYDLLYNELREGRPIFFGASSTGGGHAFVLDGYTVNDGEPYFHVNWGWSGGSDGYFKLTLMNPSNQGTGSSSTADGYTNSQSACIGLQPATTSPENYGLVLMGHIWDATKDDIPHQISVINITRRPATFLIAFAECQADGTADLNRLCGEMSIETPAFDNLSDKDCYFTLPANITDGLTAGTHNLAVVYKEAGTNAPWRNLFGSTYVIELTVKGDGTTEAPIFHPCPKFSADAASIHINGPMQTFIPLSVSATISNSGEETIQPLELLVYSITDGVLTSKETRVKTSIFSEAGTATDILFEGASFTTPGQYVGIIAVPHRDSGDNEGEEITKKLDFTGMTLDEVMADPAYLGHTFVTIEPLPFTCDGIEYVEHETTPTGVSCHTIRCQLNNGTAMDYNSLMLGKIYRMTDDGGKEQINLNGLGYTVTPVNLAANTQGIAKMAFFDDLQPGNYVVEVLIYKDFQGDINNAILSSFFSIATMPLTISTTGIVLMEDSLPFTAYGLQGNCQWYDLNGRPLQSKPTMKGNYIHGGRIVIIK